MIRTAMKYLSWTLVVGAIGYAIAILTLCDAWTTKVFHCSRIDDLTTYYEEYLRGHLFAGLVALGGFLLSLKTFIIVNMKENVFDNQKYQDNWKKQRALDESLTLYGPLRELSDILYYAILASILSGGLQLTVGLYPHWSTALICILSALYAMSLLTKSLLLIKNNLGVWFAHLAEHEKELVN